MTYAPTSYLNARTYLIANLDAYPGVAVDTDLDPAEVGIVGDTAHGVAGTSYHLGKGQLRSDAYSIALPRDRAGLTDGAAALDVGYFRRQLANGAWADLRDMSIWIVAECRAGAPDTLWIREIGYSPDGQLVLHWDRQRGVASLPKAGVFDDSHRWHSHFSGYRDCEGNDKTAIFARYLATRSGGPVTIPTQPPAPPSTDWRSKLAVGCPLTRRPDSNAWVRVAQGALVAAGKLANDPRGQIDGWFGTQTEAATKALQQARGFQVDGVIGPQTWTGLLSVADYVQRGSTGLATRLCQGLLCARGRWVTIDGIAGPITTGAIQDFQRSVGLEDDGIAGPATFPRLVHG